MMKKYLALLFLLLPATAYPQGARYDGVAQRTVQGFLAPIPGATVTVCTSAGTGTPCAPITPIYTDQGLTQQITGSVVTADSLGNFGFWAPAGSYTYSITATGVTGKLFSIVLSCFGVGACTVTGPLTVSGTATFANITCKNFGGIRCVDAANSAGWAGSDPGAWICSAKADLPATGGIIDARGAIGNFTITKCTLDKAGVTLLLPPVVASNWTYAGTDTAFQPSANNITIRDGNILLTGNAGYAVKPVGTVSHLVVDHMTILGDNNQSGTLSVTNGNATVTGTGTNFPPDLAGGQINVLQSGVVTTANVLARNSATSLTLTAGFGGTTQSGITTWYMDNNQVCIGNFSGQILVDIHYTNNECSFTTQGINATVQSSGSIDGLWIEKNYIHDIQGSEPGAGYGTAVQNIITKTVNGIVEYIPMNAHILNNTYEHNGRHDVYVGGGAGIEVSGNKSYFHRDRYGPSGSSSLRSAFPIVRSSDVISRGNMCIDSVDGCFEIDTDTVTTVNSTNITLQENLVRNSAGNFPITVGESSPVGQPGLEAVNIIGNSIYQDETATGANFGNSLLTVYSGKRVSIKDNHFYDLNKTTTGNVIQVRGSGETAGTATFTDDIQIKDNHVYGTLSGGALYLLECYTTCSTSGIRITLTNNEPTNTLTGTFLFDAVQTDANIYATLTPITGNANLVLSLIKGIPIGFLAGTTTNDSAAAGIIGEYVSSTIATGSSVSLTTNTTANVTSISLTAGDWDVTGAVDFTFGATTSYTNLVGSISTTSATLGAQDSKFDFETPAAVPTASADATWVLPTVRMSLASTTTVFLVAQGTFTVSTLKAYGTIRARRVR